MLDEAYEMGVDSCVEIVRSFLSQMPGLYEPLIIRLKELKKKP
jgi:hypothetical protein